MYISFVGFLNTRFANRDLVDCLMVDKLCNANIHNMVDGCFIRLFIFKNRPL